MLRAAPLKAFSSKPAWCGRCGHGPDIVRFDTRRTRCLACIILDKGERLARRRPPAKPRRRVHLGQLDAAYLGWVRGLACAVGYGCSGIMHAHHVRAGTGGGMGLKPADRWAVPLCAGHHGLGHAKGWIRFEGFYRLDLRSYAETLQARYAVQSWEKTVKTIRCAGRV